MQWAYTNVVQKLLKKHCWEGVWLKYFDLNEAGKLADGMLAILTLDNMLDGIELAIDGSELVWIRFWIVAAEPGTNI